MVKSYWYFYNFIWNWTESKGGREKCFIIQNTVTNREEVFLAQHISKGNMLRWHEESEICLCFYEEQLCVPIWEE